MGIEATRILYNYSYRIKDCIKNNNVSEAINILEATMETMGEFYIDGSNGEHEEIQSDFKEVMKMLLKKATSKDKKVFLPWLKEYIEEKDEFIDYKDEFKEVYNKYIS